VFDASKVVQRRHTENPRTVLAFYATVLGLALATIVALVGTLATTEVYTEAIPYLLGFGALLLVLLLGGVFAVTLADPSKLMLGQVTGMEYAEIQRVQLGDSRTGEDILAIRESPVAPSVGLAEDDVVTLEPIAIGGAAPTTAGEDQDDEGGDA
jgi:hypothetical protein